MTRENLVENASAGEALEALGGVRSIVDVDVYVWQEESDRWRLLTLAEQRVMLDLAAPAAG